MFSKKRSSRRKKMDKQRKPSRVSAKPAEMAAATVVRWLQSNEGRSHSSHIFQQTEKMLQQYRALQAVEPSTVQRPVTL